MIKIFGQSPLSLNTSNNKQKGESSMRKVIAILLVVVMVFGVCACSSSEDLIIGTWKNQTTILGVVTETKYTFNEDGTGTKNLIFDMDFKYAISGNTLSIKITTLGVETTEEFAFEFEGAKLKLTKDGETQIFDKVN